MFSYKRSLYETSFGHLQFLMHDLGIRKEFRLIAFWDKSQTTDTLVIATHGFIKKTSKTPKAEIHRAGRLRQEYFNDKRKGNENI